MNYIMKKLFFVAAALLAAVTINAEIVYNYTCAEALEAVGNMAENTTGTDSVAITGYVTVIDKAFSNFQARFYMDDVKGSGQKTVQSYYCSVTEPVELGDLVRIKGFLQNYYGTAEIANGLTEFIEKAVVDYDTTTVTVCQAIAVGSYIEAGKDSGTEIYKVAGTIADIPSENTQYGHSTFNLACGEDKLNIYQCAGVGFNLGDSVEVVGRLKNYNGTIEIVDGTITLLEITTIVLDTIPVTGAGAIAAGQLLDSAEVSENIYAITGYVDSIAYSYRAGGTMSFFMTDNMEDIHYNFEAYKVAPVDEETGNAIEPGSKVVVTGPIKHYKAAATDTKPATDLIETDGGKVALVTQTALDEIKTDTQAVKTLRNGQIVIRKGDKLFNVLGAEL